MEFANFPPLVMVVSFVTFVFVLMKLLKITKNSSPLNQIPGPKRLPLIGNLHNLIALKHLPIHHAFKHLATKYGAMMHLRLGEVSFVVVSSVEAAKQVLRTHDVTFANRPSVLVSSIMSYDSTDILFAPYGEHWRYLRKVCTLELFSPSRVLGFRHIREEENWNLAKWFASMAGSPADVSERVYLSSFDIAARASTGKKTQEQETIAAAMKKAVETSSGYSLVDLYPSSKLLPVITGVQAKIEGSFREIDRILGSIVEKHRVARADKKDDERSSEDLVDVLLKCQEDGSEVPLSTDTIKGVLLDIFNGGGESSANVVEWCMSEMMRNGAALAKAQKEVREVFDVKGYVDEAEFGKLVYLKLVIKESLRLHPPAPLLVPRESSQPCRINGYELPAKTKVIINAGALARDPMYWKDDADKFKPERFMNSSVDYKGNDFQYIPFGAGRRICPAMSFGLANVEFTLAMLLYHFDWGMPNGMETQELDMTECVGSVVKRKHHLILVPTLIRPLKHLIKK